MNIALVRQLTKKGFTKKQIQAMCCAIAAEGSFTVAAKNCKEKYKVSPGYLRDLMYSEEYRAWQAELESHLNRDLPQTEDLDENYVIKGLMELTEAHVQDSVRLGAYRSLADLMGMWAPKETILRVEDLKRLESMGITREQILAEVEEILNEGLRAD